MTNGERYGAYGSSAMFNQFCRKFNDCLTGCPLYSNNGEDCRSRWENLPVEVTVVTPAPAMAYLAWYLTGGATRQDTLLGVFRTKAAADAAAEEDKQNRYTDHDPGGDWCTTEEELKG